MHKGVFYQDWQWPEFDFWNILSGGRELTSMFSSCAWWHKCTHIQMWTYWPSTPKKLPKERIACTGFREQLGELVFFSPRGSQVSELGGKCLYALSPLTGPAFPFCSLQFFQECRGVTQRSAGQWESVWEGVMPLASAVQLTRIATSCSGGPDMWVLERKVIWVLCKAKGREAAFRYFDLQF